MKMFLFVTMMVVSEFLGLSATAVNIGCDITQNRSSTTVHAYVSETIDIELVNSSNIVVYTATFEGTGNHTINTTNYESGVYVLNCSYTSGNDVFNINISN